MVMNDTEQDQHFVADSIKKYGKSKGYESLPRELLQSKELPLEAIGLLCNLQSYPDNWVLIKTELRRRFVNSEKAVDRIWDILVEKGYILQFRRREGKKYVYQYFFNVEKFTLEEVQELLEKMFQRGMLLYHKSIKKGISEPEELKSVLCLSDEDKKKLDLSFWTSQKRNSKKDCDTNDSSTSQNDKSKLEIPNTEDSKLTTKKSTTKKFNKKEEEDNKEKQQFTELIGIIEESENLKYLSQILLESNMGISHILKIAQYFNQDPDLFDIDVVKQQLSWMEEKSKNDSGIANISEYFINGYADRLKAKNIKSNFDIKEEFYKRIGKSIPEEDLPKVTLQNWLE